MKNCYLLFVLLFANYAVAQAPPAFIQNLSPYQGVLMSSKNISLTCRVECSPLCSITWYKDGHQLEFNNNPLYYVKTAVFAADLRKNYFESIESTLVWNMTAWPGEMLDRTAPNSNYTCQSSRTAVGPGVNSTIEIAVDYPPENLTVSNTVVHVVENHKPEKIFCNGKGHPALSYVWRREGASEPLTKTNILNLGAVPRTATGNYICEATNRHGNETIRAFLNVKYSPTCIIDTVEYDGGLALECTAVSNPHDVTFTWKIKGENDTIETPPIDQRGIKGYLRLDSSIDSFRTYQCYVNNTVGMSSPCERDVTESIKRRPIILDFHNITVPVGGTANMSCRAASSLNYYVTWLKGYQDESSFNSTVHIEESEALLSREFFELHNVTHEQEGWYTCVAANSLGHTMSSAYLKVVDDE